MARVLGFRVLGFWGFRVRALGLRFRACVVIA